MKPLLIVADDLTGAADCAARCRAAGLAARILVDPPRGKIPAGATAFTTDSRHLLPDQAIDRVRKALSPLAGMDVHWYKKIDSVLRGHVGQEIDAAMDVLSCDTCVVCPAFPQQGRTVRGGHVLAPGVEPGQLHLPSVLREQSRRSVVSLGLADVRTDALPAQLQAARSSGAELLAVDAVEVDDLHEILDSIATHLPGALLCGSAGLVGAFAQRQARDAQTPAVAVGAAASVPAATLTVVGSSTAIAHRQIDSLRSRSDVSVLQVAEAEPSLLEERLATLDGTRPHWLLHLARTAVQSPAVEHSDRARLAHLVRAARLALTQRPTERLLLSGGETALAVLRALAIDHLEVMRELLPGIPLCRPEGAAASGEGAGDVPVAQIVLKPGSFGDDTALATLLAK